MAATRFPTQLLINGTSVTGEGRAESVLNPSTGEVLCEVREASADQLESDQNGSSRDGVLVHLPHCSPHPASSA